MPTPVSIEKVRVERAETRPALSGKLLVRVEFDFLKRPNPQWFIAGAKVYVQSRF